MLIAGTQLQACSVSSTWCPEKNPNSNVFAEIERLLAVPAPSPSLSSSACSFQLPMGLAPAAFEFLTPDLEPEFYLGQEG